MIIHRESFISKSDLKHNLEVSNIELDILYKAIKKFSNITVSVKVYDDIYGFGKIKSVLLENSDTQEIYNFKIRLE